MYFLNGVVRKEPKNKKNESFRYFYNRYVEKVPKNRKMKVLDTFPVGTLEKYLKMKN